MHLVFSPQAWEEYLEWQESDSKTAGRINLLIADTLSSPFVGIGKPEPLKHALRGYWSRRINLEHRFLYKVAGDQLWIVRLRYHY